MCWAGPNGKSNTKILKAQVLPGCHVREYGVVDPGKWMAAGYAHGDLSLGMRKRGLGSDEMFVGVIPAPPEEVDSRDHFANAIRGYARTLPVTIA